MTQGSDGLSPTREIKTTDKGIELTLYDQEGNLTVMSIKDTPFNRKFAVWCRRFDR